MTDHLSGPPLAPSEDTRDADVEELILLAEKMERETQVYLGFRNIERAAVLRGVIARLRASQSPDVASPTPEVRTNAH